MVDDEREKDLKFMSDPEKWPEWPWLPMKRRVPGEHPELALLHADCEADKPTPLYKINLFQLKTWFPTHKMPKTKEYKTFDEMLADGWEVD